MQLLHLIINYVYNRGISDRIPYPQCMLCIQAYYCSSLFPMGTSVVANQSEEVATFVLFLGIIVSAWEGGKVKSNT